MIMTPAQLKGALLEFMVRRLLSNCGFAPAIADNLYTFERGGLFFVNGKGAAHDADVLMEPPVQMPFSYPSRVLFECKAHDKQIGLPIIRNVLGLRSDINEFEIVTKDSIVARQNNRRAAYAIEERKRFNYQVGVAVANEFTKPAIEFAANNKIPLLSLTWFLDQLIIDLFHSINNNDLAGVTVENWDRVYIYLKDRSKSADQNPQHDRAKNVLNQHEKLSEIIKSFNNVLARSYVGLIETGDLIFLFPTNAVRVERLNERDKYWDLRAQIHYFLNEPNIWRLEIFDEFVPNNNIVEFKFFVPQRIMNIWKKCGLDKAKAIEFKGEFFSRIFIFNRINQQNMPFFIVNIDRQWLDRIRN